MKLRTMLTVGLLALTVSGIASAKNDKDQLPPGLQKKIAQGKELPPGWQKKLHRGHVIDEVVYSHGSVERHDDIHEIVHVEDKIIKIIKNTREIVEILNN